MPYYQNISGFVYDCSSCPTRCDGKSKKRYDFEEDARFSEQYEDLIIRKINEYPQYLAAKTQKDGYPDIEIKKKANGELFRFLEIKVQRRTFMTVKKHLLEANLFPSETLALNLSDLIRYFDIQKETGIPTSILWVLLNRPCIVKNEPLLFYQTTDVLEEIYHKYRDKRRFRRKSGKGDVVDGVHKGVVVNYHFSLGELKEWKLGDFSL